MDLHLLAIETSSNVCGVSLLSRREGAVSIRSLSHDARGEHAERLLPMVDQLLAQNNVGRSQLSAIAFGQGPGGFTGLRIACGVAQGMAFALGLPLIPVVSLQAVAAREAGDEPIRVVVQDARMDEVFAAAYRLSPGAGRGDEALDVLNEPVLLSVDDVAHWLSVQTAQWKEDNGQLAIRLMGDALEAYPRLADIELGNARLHIGSAARASSEAVARLGLQAFLAGRSVAPEQAAPLYVRDRVAFTTQEREKGFGGNPKAQALTARLARMTHEHLDEVAAIERSVQSFPWSRQNFSDALNAGYSAWVALKESRVVGFCVTMLAPDVAHLLLIAVAPDEHRRGVGYTLLRQSEADALSHDLNSIILEVRPSNLRAISFYQNRGYRQLATRKDYYPSGKGLREDAWVLEKRLCKGIKHD